MDAAPELLLDAATLKNVSRLEGSLLMEFAGDLFADANERGDYHAAFSAQYMYTIAHNSITED